tara:strand:- start:967 stop:1500 length:534 start_codon:yes stop_codon:yes gene_type:complete
MLMLTLFNQDVKGLIYLAGIMMALVANIVIQYIIQDEPDPNRELFCDLFSPISLSPYTSPSTSSLFIAFTIAYLLLPMKYNNNMNYGVILFLLFMFTIDAYVKTYSKCSSISGSIIGGLAGFLFGCIWYAIFHATGYDSLLYFDTYSSNRVFCAKPSKQSFKCSVYKNGKIISSSVA